LIKFENTIPLDISLALNYSRLKREIKILQETDTSLAITTSANFNSMEVKTHMELKIESKFESLLSIPSSGLTQSPLSPSLSSESENDLSLSVGTTLSDSFITSSDSNSPEVQTQMELKIESKFGHLPSLGDSNQSPQSPSLLSESESDTSLLSITTTLSDSISMEVRNGIESLLSLPSLDVFKSPQSPSLSSESERDSSSQSLQQETFSPSGDGLEKLEE